MKNKKMMVKVCEDCGIIYSVKDKVCEECGAKLSGPINKETANQISDTAGGIIDCDYIFPVNGWRKTVGIGSVIVMISLILLMCFHPYIINTDNKDFITILYAGGISAVLLMLIVFFDSFYPNQLWALSKPLYFFDQLFLKNEIEPSGFAIVFAQILDTLLVLGGMAFIVFLFFI